MVVQWVEQLPLAWATQDQIPEGVRISPPIIRGRDPKLWRMAVAPCGRLMVTGHLGPIVAPLTASCFHDDWQGKDTITVCHVCTTPDFKNERLHLKLTNSLHRSYLVLVTWFYKQIATKAALVELTVKPVLQYSLIPMSLSKAFPILVSESNNS